MVESYGLSSVVTDYLEPSDTASQGTDRVRPLSDSTTETSKDSEPSKRSLGVMASVLLVAVVVVGGAIAVGGFGDKGVGTDSTNPAGLTTETATVSPTTTITPTQSVTEARPLIVGESATQDGLRLTVRNYTFADHLGNTSHSFGTPAEGAKFLLVHISVENIGNVQQEPPTRIRLYYYNEQIDRHGLFSENFTVNGQRYKHYFGDGFNSKLYPGDHAF